uniref:LAGLIDADG endonuclease n=1 Tax=Powellomyces hirtus TaxID=109895 RepID=A0A4P8NPB7_9FUNG|nr:LAGLIDADG endonuclease [Powellomyces hirtus]
MTINLCLFRQFSSIPTRSMKGSKDNEFGHYLAGYIEGDGTIITPFSLKTPNGNKRVCSIQIVFHVADLEFVKLLRERIGHGNIYFTKGSNTVRLMIQNIQGVLYIINLINGKMRTPKIVALHRMIDWLNKYQLKNLGGQHRILTKLPLDSSPINSNSWLAGFIDTDGCFSIKGFTSEKAHPGFQFYLCQREKDKNGSLHDIMSTIAKFLEVSLKLRSANGYSQWNITTSSSKCNLILSNYLTRFPLFTSKYLNYMDWKYASELYYIKEHLNNIVISDKIKNIKLNMNSHRKTFSWSHLIHFY